MLSSSYGTSKGLREEDRRRGKVQAHLGKWGFRDVVRGDHVKDRGSGLGGGVGVLSSKDGTSGAGSDTRNRLDKRAL